MTGHNMCALAEQFIVRIVALGNMVIPKVKIKKGFIIGKKNWTNVLQKHPLFLIPNDFKTCRHIIRG